MLILLVGEFKQGYSKIYSSIYAFIGWLKNGNTLYIVKHSLHNEIFPRNILQITEVHRWIPNKPV